MHAAETGLHLNVRPQFKSFMEPSGPLVEDWMLPAHSYMPTFRPRSRSDQCLERLRARSLAISSIRKCLARAIRLGLSVIQSSLKAFLEDSYLLSD